MTTLLVTENKSSEELLLYIDQLIDSRDENIRHKIQNVKKKNGKEFPVILFSNGKTITDINEIYFYIMSKPKMAPQRSANPYLDNMDYDDYLQDHHVFGNDGEPIRGKDFDDERTTRRPNRSSRSSKNRGDESESEEPMPDKQALEERFNERRKPREIPKIRRKPRKHEESSGSEVADGKEELDRYYTQQARSQ
jgi:hypothetical protein